MGSVERVKEYKALGILSSMQRLVVFWCSKIPWMVAILFISVASLAAWGLGSDKKQAHADDPPHAISIAGISPDNGPIAGGTVITVTGSGFRGEYERVEALWFDGNSYIDTGVSNRGRDINVRFRMDTTNTATANVVFGTSSADTTGRIAFAKAAGGSGAYTAYKGTGAVGGTGNSRIRVGLRNDVTIDSAGATFHVNGSQIDINGTVSENANIWIGGAANPAGYYRGYFYALRTYASSVIDHNFVPVKKVSLDYCDDNDTANWANTPECYGKYGVVDIVTGEYYDNTGSGVILGGTVDTNWNLLSGEIIAGAISPDSLVEVLIDNRPCTGVTIVSDSELTCHTPSGLSLGKKD